ncbi:MAG: polysaccharide pyruvyl transferase family protein [Planctomycetota bacterium]
MITLFCIHPHGFNIGNDAIHVALRGLLDEAFGELVNVISIPATTRFESHGRAGLSPSVVHEINQYADGVIVGGGNLFENGQLDVAPVALRALEPPMMMFSLSRGRIYGRKGQLVDRTDVMPDQTLRALHEASMLSLARDSATTSYLQSIGCERVELGGCPTVGLGSIADRLPPVAEHDRDQVLISVRNPSLMNIPLEAQAAVRGDVTQLIAQAERWGGQTPRLLCHDHRDIPFAASFRGVEYVYTGDVYRFLALLNAARLNITYRLHSALPCLAFGTPFVNVSYDERAQSVLETIGLGEWNVNLMAPGVRQSGGVAGAVQDRLNDLGELPGVVARSQPVRDGLLRVMRDGLASFRDAVHAYSGQSPEGAEPCSTRRVASM